LLGKAFLWLCRGTPESCFSSPHILKEAVIIGELIVFWASKSLLAKGKRIVAEKKLYSRPYGNWEGSKHSGTEEALHEMFLLGKLSTRSGDHGVYGPKIGTTGPWNRRKSLRLPSAWNESNFGKDLPSVRQPLDHRFEYGNEQFKTSSFSFGR
jgi:hypothetical protein